MMYAAAAAAAAARSSNQAEGFRCTHLFLAPFVRRLSPVQETGTRTRGSIGDSSYLATFLRCDARCRHSVIRRRFAFVSPDDHVFRLLLTHFPRLREPLAEEAIVT